MGSLFAYEFWGAAVTEQRAALWVGMVCTLFVARPTARVLRREWQVHRVRRVALRQQAARMLVLPPDWTRDLYGSVR